MRFWSSDWHFGHFNVIKYCSRPFYYIEEHDAALIENWNKLVSVNDDAVFVGDALMNHRYLTSILKLNFKSLVWVLGNHDKEGKIRRALAEDGCLYSISDKVTVLENYQTKIKDMDVYAVHRPINAHDQMNTICGHVHERWKMLHPGDCVKEYSFFTKTMNEKELKVPVLNVGVDVFGFYPVEDEEIYKIFKNRGEQCT